MISEEPKGLWRVGRKGSELPGSLPFPLFVLFLLKIVFLFLPVSATLEILLPCALFTPRYSSPIPLLPYPPPPPFLHSLSKY